MANLLKNPKKILEAAADAIETAVDKAGDTVEVIAEKAGDTKERIDKAYLSPIFNLTEMADDMPRVIHVEDSQRLRNTPVCEGAIGHYETIRGMHMLRLLPENTALPGIKFYPTTDGILYYRDPYDDHKYIELDDYYDYLNEVRVNEIKNVAHDLGAKYIKVVYKEEKKSYVSVDAKVQAKEKGKGIIKVAPEAAAEAEHHQNKTEYTNIDVLAEVDYEGSDKPTMPALKYLKKDPAINSLIQRRMDGDRSIKKETYSIKCKTLNGLHTKDAIKLDGVLKALKIGGNASVRSDAEAEERAILEYTIEF